MPVVRSKKKFPKLTNTVSPSWLDQMYKMKEFWLILAVRISSVFFTSTEFVPDEAWQSTQVAYYYVFGRGHLTWEWDYGLRSYIYPFCIGGLYWVLKVMGMDTPYSLVMGPRLFSALLTSLGEYCMFLWCVRRWGAESGRWTLGVSLTNWFSYYTGSRTLTNSVEMSLNSIAILLLERDRMVWFTGIVALNFVIRPTALVLWLPQALPILRRFFPLRHTHRLPASVLIGLGVITLGSVLDSVIKGTPTVAWLRFILFNFLQGGSAQFGEHHPLWYLYSALPSILGPSLLLLPLSLYFRLHSSEWTTISSFIFTFSLIRHKEIRFLLPILPYLYGLMGHTLHITSLSTSMHTNQPQKTSSPSKERVNSRRLFMNLVGVCLLTHTLAALYFCGFHQGAIYPLTQFINTASVGIKQPSIWILSGCYSVPVFTYLHNPSASFQFLSCGPKDLGLEDKLENFERFNTKNFTTTELRAFIEEKTEGLPYPDFILCGELVTGRIVKLLGEMGEDVEVCKTHPHAQFGDDRGILNVICRKKRPP